MNMSKYMLSRNNQCLRMSSPQRIENFMKITPLSPREEKLELCLFLSII